MIDFNNIPIVEAGGCEVERESIRADLIARLDSVLTTMFPAGKKRKGKFLIGDALGSPGDSLEVVLDGEPMNLEEMAKAKGCSRERIRQIEAKALRKLRAPARQTVLMDVVVEAS